MMRDGALYEISNGYESWVGDMRSMLEGEVKGVTRGGFGVSNLIMARSIFSQGYRYCLMYILAGIRFSKRNEARLSFDFYVSSRCLGLLIIQAHA